MTFLPATWGRLEQSHKGTLSALVGEADLLVRDRYSASNINDILGSDKAVYCPDLTFLYQRGEPDIAKRYLEKVFVDPTKPLLGIIPNVRCIQDGVSPLVDSRHYLEFLARSRDWAVMRGFNVLGISHMVDTDRDLFILRELEIDPLPSDALEVVRATIANLTVCISSRYHGLTSCLSHGVPVLSLGWHHKYRNLMEDMSLGRWHVPVENLPMDPEILLPDLVDNLDEVGGTIERNVASALETLARRVDALKAGV